MEKLKLGAAGGGGAISAEAMSICLFLLITIFLSAAFGIGIGIGSGSEQQLVHNNKEGLSTKAYTSLSERVKAMFSLSSTTQVVTPTPRIWSSSWNKAQSLFNQLQAYFLPPNLDFRGRKEVESDGGAAGEKVKEAMAKSFGKSRATVEDSAKSAAKFAGETLHITADKVKKSFSHPDHHHQTSSDDDQAEL